MTKQLTRIKLRLCYYWDTTITYWITTDYMCAKTDISRMFHEADKGGWFTYILWQDWKYKAIYEKNIVNKNTLGKHYSCWWVWDLRIPIRAIKFSLKLTILTFWTKFAQKEHFWLKKKKVNTANEFCIIKLV